MHNEFSYSTSIENAELQKVTNPAINLTHLQQYGSFVEAIKLIKEKIMDRGNLPHTTVERQLELIDQLCEFPLGRYILERKGANGFWTDYMLNHPNTGRISGVNIEGKPFSILEDYLLNRSPTITAHQERFSIYQDIIKNKLRNNMVIASIPCGLMRDLLVIDFSNYSNIKLVGLDIDEESLSLAKNLANDNGIKNIHLLQQDAWQLQFDDEFDIITSSGLNVYESNRDKVQELYYRFYKAIKFGGSLIISVLTYPPFSSEKTDWKIDQMCFEDIVTEQVLYKDILELNWRNFRFAEELHREFENVGFSDINVYYDKYNVFPTIVANKTK